MSFWTKLFCIGSKSSMPTNKMQQQKTPQIAPAPVPKPIQSTITPKSINSLEEFMAIFRSSSHDGALFFSQVNAAGYTLSKKMSLGWGDFVEMQREDDYFNMIMANGGIHTLLHRAGRNSTAITIIKEGAQVYHGGR